MYIRLPKGNRRKLRNVQRLAAGHSSAATCTFLRRPVFTDLIGRILALTSTERAGLAEPTAERRG
jgi:hypothetical protein